MCACVMCECVVMVQLICHAAQQEELSRDVLDDICCALLACALLSAVAAQHHQRPGLQLLPSP
jgi:hypothetical protein